MTGRGLGTGVRTRLGTGARPRPATATRVVKGVLLVAIPAAAFASGCASAVGGGPGSEGHEAWTGGTVVDRATWLREKGFEDRGDWRSAALHLDRVDLANFQRFREILRKAPGLRIRPRPGNLWGVERVTGPTGAPCPVSVYLNGSRLVQSAPQARVSLDAFIPAPSLDGLELHVGASGPLGEVDECGSLLLWAWERREHDEEPFRGSIRGTVRSSRPDTAVSIRVRKADSGSFAVLPPGDTILYLDSDGAFALDGLLPGRYRLEILGPDGAAAPGKGLAPGSVLAQQDLSVYAFRESVLRIDIIRGNLAGGS